MHSRLLVAGSTFMIGLMARAALMIRFVSRAALVIGLVIGLVASRGTPGDPIVKLICNWNCMGYPINQQMQFVISHLHDIFPLQIALRHVLLSSGV